MNDQKNGKHMLPWPLIDFDLRDQDVDCLFEVLMHVGNVTLGRVVAEAITQALIRQAVRAKGSKRVFKDDAFVTGARLYAISMTKKILRDAENDFLLPMCDLDIKSDSIYEELYLFGKRYLTEAGA